ncbi:MAG TPA: hypothetical protein VMQ10_15400, partial [Spirochaetia bacterium]|nr:hypothetical protein [Spirochaetia bacterium]
MRYRIRASSGRAVELALSTPERPLLLIVLSLFSAVCLLVGLVYALAATDSADPLRALMFTGLGLFFLSAIFLLPGAFAFPARLVFDSEAAVLRL